MGEMFGKSMAFGARSLDNASGTSPRDQAGAQYETPKRHFDIAAAMAGFSYWTIDLVTGKVVWSHSLYALLGRDATRYQPHIATQLDIYMPEDRLFVIEHFQRAINTGEDFDFALRILRQNDQVPRLIRIRGGVEHDDGGPARLCGVVRDVTDEASVTDPFLGRVADELRAPLNDIARYARLIETQPFPDGDIAGYAHNLLASAERLKALISAESDRACDKDMEHINLAPLIIETVDAFQFQAMAAQCRLNTYFVDFIHSTARLDVMRFQQVLQNLISNACKFTCGGIISVTASQVIAENPETLKPVRFLHVSVRDTGAGMDEALVRSLRNGSRTRRQQGVGLSVAKTVVEWMGGQIGIVSKPGKGTTVWFEIPVEGVEAPATVMSDPRTSPVPRTLTRQNFAQVIGAPGSHIARASVHPRFEAPPASQPRRHSAVDDNRINREYLRAALHDMKLDR